MFDIPTVAMMILNKKLGQNKNLGIFEEQKTLEGLRRVGEGVLISVFPKLTTPE